MASASYHAVRWAGDDERTQLKWQIGHRVASETPACGKPVHTFCPCDGQVTVNGRGPIGQMTAVSLDESHVKGFVGNPAADPPLNSKGKVRTFKAP